MPPRITDHVHLGRRCCAALTVLLSIAGTARGEQQPLEEIVVTGSRIARRDFESASPIVSIGRERFEQTGSATIDSTVISLPQFVPSVTSTSNNPANGGQANVSLRGLGATSTLVLLDGRRLMPANGTGVVDLNIVPSSLIDSVEVITGGASAVYGSDAMAGVVNFKLRKDFDGVEINGLWGQTDRSDGAQYEGTLSVGTDFAGGRGRIAAAVNYARRNIVTGADRDFTRYSLEYYGPGQGTPGLPPGFRAAGSVTIEEGRADAVAASREAFAALFSSYGNTVCDGKGKPPGCFAYQGAANLSFNADGSLFTTGNKTPGSVLNFRGQIDPLQYNDAAYAYNFAPGNALQLPLERKDAFVRVSFDLSENAEVYLQGLYADYDVSTMLAPTPAQMLYMPPSNPYVPADLKFLLDSRADPDAPFLFRKRLTELGPRIEDLNYSVYQITAGVQGAMFAGWQYDAYVQWGANEQTDRQTNNALRSRIEALTFAADGGESICGGFDPFGLDSISRECADYIAIDGINHAEVGQAIAEAAVNGPLFSLPAGEVRAVLGIFYKRDQYRYDADPVVSAFITSPGTDCDTPDDPCRSDIVGFNPSDDIDGDDANVDVYVETLVPLLADLPGFRRLELVAGYRRSDYESIGGVDAYKGELLWKPADAVTLRGSYQRAVRAPSVFELYLPQLPLELSVGSVPGDYEVQDPCAFDSAERADGNPNRAGVEALCLAQGIPPALLPAYYDTDQQLSAVTGGNPELHQERAKTITVGMVLAPHADSRWFEQLQISLDWYRIQIENQIADVGASYAISACYDANVNPEFSPANRWCQSFRRDTVTGEIENAHEIKQNLAGSETSGVDLQLDWRVGAGPGELSLNWLVSYVFYADFTASAGTPPDELLGTIGSSYFESSLPDWKSNLGLSYAWRDLQLSVRWQHIDGMADFKVPEFHVPAYDYFDLGATYGFNQGRASGLTLRVGVENVADEDPPVFPSLIQANTDPSQYDVLGRRYYVGFKEAF